jgi:hypothetical protein
MLIPIAVAVAVAFAIAFAPFLLRLTEAAEDFRVVAVVVADGVDAVVALAFSMWS